jgi:mannose-6-phosphate isomerase-like protein (cupin superfamily)
MSGCGKQPPVSTLPLDHGAFQKPPFEQEVKRPSASREILQRTDQPPAGSPSSFHTNIIQTAFNNTLFRKVLFTTERSQVAVMSIEPGKDLGAEAHDSDQVIVFVGGEGEFQVRDHRGRVQSGDMLAVPAHAKHNITNTGTVRLSFYTIYAPPEHAPGTVQRTKPE